VAVHDDWGVRTPRWAGIRSDWIDVHGTSVHVLAADRSAAGTPHLLVHGLGGGATNWLEVMAPLSERGPVIAPDLPGFGRTEPPYARASRVDLNARFLRALLAAVGWDRVILHGSSMGGTVALLLADLLGDRVERMVLAAPALPGRTRDLRRLDRLTVRRFAPFLVPPLGGAMLRRTYLGTTPEQLWKENAAYVHADPARVSPEMRELGLDSLRDAVSTPWRLPSFVHAAASLVRAVVSRRALQGAIGRIDAPTLVLRGDADRLVGRAVTDRLAALRPDWEVVSLGDVGHAPMIETPDRYLAAVGDWLDGRPPAPERVTV
jgi:pimeloyl-ACP methyl ester carboxylesterase